MTTEQATIPPLQLDWLQTFSDDQIEQLTDQVIRRLGNPLSTPSDNDRAQLRKIEAALVKHPNGFVRIQIITATERSDILYDAVERPDISTSELKAIVGNKNCPIDLLDTIYSQLSQNAPDHGREFSVLVDIIQKPGLIPGGVDSPEQVLRDKIIHDNRLISLFFFAGRKDLTAKEIEKIILNTDRLSMPNEKNLRELFLSLSHQPNITVDLLNLIFEHRDPEISKIGSAHLESNKQDLIVGLKSLGFDIDPV